MKIALVVFQKFLKEIIFKDVFFIYNDVNYNV